MIAWTEKKFMNHDTWYHGTTKIGAKRIQEKVIANINKGRGSDFGYGFYLTPNLKWALKFAKQMVADSDDDNQINANDGYVLQFNFIPNVFKDSCKIKFFSQINDEYINFVFKNQICYKWHIITKCIHSYDIVGGPMADGALSTDFLDYQQKRITKGELFEKLMKPREDWQLLIHSQNVCNHLKVSKIYNLEGREVNHVS